MKRYSPILVIIILLSINVISCKRSPEEVERDLLNEWIWEGMNNFYYWYEDLDRDLYPSDLEPEDFFYELLHPSDRFSWIVDDYQELINSFNNIEVSNGISPYFIRVTNSDKIVIVVEHIAPGSPADIAGIERGDIITDINGSEIAIHNYSDLFYTETTTLEFADYIDGSFIPNDREITLTAIVIDENPLHHYELINYEGTEIGYMVYNHFTAGDNDKWLDSLDYQLSEIQSSGVKELIIDIRYNPGGSIFMANHIASALSPATVPGNDNVFIYLQWNDLFEEYIISKEGEESASLVSYFEEAPATNLDLNKIHFLTSSRSASASELLLIGLEPYMDVVHIGDTTYGKGFGSITIDDWEEPKRHEWAMQPITFKYANSLGNNVSFEGLAPEYAISDFLLDAKPFGDITDPMLAKALELITGVSPLAKKAAPVQIQYQVMPDPVRERKNKAILELKKFQLPDAFSKSLY